MRERHGDVLGSCSPRHMAVVASRGQRFARAVRGRARLVAIMTSRLRSLSGPPGAEPTPALAGGSERVARAERGRARLAAIAARRVRPTSGPPGADPTPAVAGGGQRVARAGRGRVHLAAIARPHLGRREQTPRQPWRASTGTCSARCDSGAPGAAHIWTSRQTPRSASGTGTCSARCDRPELGTGMAGIYASLSPMAWILFPFCLCPHQRVTTPRDRRRRQGTN